MIGSLKRFKILSDRYRNRRKRTLVKKLIGKGRAEARAQAKARDCSFERSLLYSQSSYIGMLEGFKKRKERRDLSFPPLCGSIIVGV